MASRACALQLFQRAYDCQRRGELVDAARLYQASIAECPTAEAHTFLGWVYSMQGRLHQAIAECKRAIAVDPSFGNPYNDIGAYLLALGRPNEAVPWLEQALRAPRYDAQHFPHVNLARVYESQGRLVDALSELTSAARKLGTTEPFLTAIRKLQARVN